MSNAAPSVIEGRDETPVTAAAANDLADIRGHVRERNPSSANRLMKQFKRIFNLLLKNPEMGGLVRLEADELRSLTVEGYVLYFRQLRSHLEIVRIVDGAREPPFMD